MNPKFTRVMIILIITLIIFKAFRHYLSDNRQVTEQLLVEDENHQKQEKVKVSVYYEALCSDSKFFITDKLLPVYEHLRDHLIIELIPYGKAQTTETDGKISFHCQHDAVECYANKIHACVIDYIDDPMITLRYVACMIQDNMIPDDAGERCGKELNIDFTKISECANDLKGSLLLKGHGEKTRALNPSVRFIPTIELNDSQSLVPQSAILKDLFKSACQVFAQKPPKCI